MTCRIPLMRNSLLHETETLTALADWLRTSPPRLSMGDQCAAFEREFADYQGRQHAILFNSGGSANLVLLQALINLNLINPSTNHNIVAFSALTWATNVMPIMQLGLVPTPVDVDPATLNIKCDLLNIFLYTSLPKVLFVTNALGNLPIDYHQIVDWCDDHDVVLIEDNCESLGSVHVSGTRAGNFGLAATFSFFVAHHMSTIEGGMVCTDDNALAEMLRMVRGNGWDRNLTPDQQQRWRSDYGVADDFSAAYTFYVPGYNLRPTEITGFLGRQQLKYLDENLRHRSIIFNALEHVASANDDLIPLDHAHMATLSPFCFPVLCKTPALRETYRQRFAATGVEVRPIIAGNITRQPFYRAVYGIGPSLPGADTVTAQGFYFGIYPELTVDDIELLMSCLIKE